LPSASATASGPKRLRKNFWKITALECQIQPDWLWNCHAEWHVS
jgi:hypothetical protein